jgi:hypothetical protein
VSALPEIEVSATSARHSRVQSLTTIQDAKATTVDELIGDEVKRTAFIRSLAGLDRRPHAHGSFLPALTAHHETLLAIDAEQAFVVRQEALPSQQGV